MLIMNKLAVHFLPTPSFVLLGQLSMSALAVFVAGAMGYIKVDALEKTKVIKFSFVAVAFLAAIYTNMKTLQYCNVETFIVFRASTPILISLCDYIFLGRELPSARSWASLAVLMIGAIMYVVTDAGFHVTGYFWVCIWYCIFTFDQIYIKHAVDTVKMESNWGRVYYTNFLSSIPLMGIGVVTGEVRTLTNFEWTFAAVAAFTVSCALGVAMSYFAFLARSAVSATYFSVIGNVCKIITILINYFMWDHHANLTGLACLMLCLVAAYFYQPAPMRKSIASQKPTGV
jgi:GDP-mannose transporter